MSALLATPVLAQANAVPGLDILMYELTDTSYPGRRQLAGIPAATGWGALMRSLQQAVPAVSLTSVGMPGCFAHVVAPQATVFLSPGPSLQLAEVIPNLASLNGITLVGQVVTFAPALTPLGLVASNAVVLTLGL